MHATAVRSTNQLPLDRERARDTAHNRVPEVARSEPIRDVTLPGLAGSTPQTHGLRRWQNPVTGPDTCRGRVPVNLVRFVCLFFGGSREKHSAKLKKLATPGLLEGPTLQILVYSL